MPDAVVGREKELEAAAEFLEEVAGGPGMLVLEGEAGIGKSTLWRAAGSLAEQQECRLLVTRPARPDRGLSYAGLGDLLAGVPSDQFSELPEPQRIALDAALLRGKAAAFDRRAAFTGLLSVLTGLAAKAPVVVAVDDLQWLDAPSARALEFAARRIRALPIGFLLSSRLGESGGVEGMLSALDHGRRRRLPIGPLTLAGTQRLLKDRLGHSFQRPILLRIHELSGGNPFFALEVGRALEDREPRPGEPLPVPADVRLLVRGRIEKLPKATRQALLRAALLSEPTATLIRGSLAPARDSGLVEEEGDRIVFTHPLYAGAVYEASSIEERRRAHRELARKAEDLEERARHLALAASGPDEGVAGELDRAAERAQARGAPEIAAQLWELAVELTPPPLVGARRRRTIDAADSYLRSGTTGRARELLTPLVDELPPGDLRATALLSLMQTAHDRDEMNALAERALLDAEGDVARSRAHVVAGWVMLPQRTIDVAVRHGRLALEHAERAGDRRLLVETLAQLSFFELAAGRMTPGLLERAVATYEEADRHSGGLADARRTLALRSLYRGQLDEARASLSQALDEAKAEGNEPDQVLMSIPLIIVELRSGNWDRAAAGARATHDAAEQIGLVEFWGMAQFWKAFVDAHLGLQSEARAAAEEGAAMAGGVGQSGFEAQNLGVLGFLELSLGNESAALAHLRPLLDHVLKTKVSMATHPFPFDFMVESLIAVGDLEEARSVLVRYEDDARQIGSPWALTAVRRCSGLLQAAEGDVDEGRLTLEETVQRYEGRQWPFEQARTLLALGRMQRRAKRKSESKRLLEQALAIFEELPAPLWAQRARDELERIGLRRAAPGQLTETESRVATLAASGLKNREVAAQLFMSPKTVEANLSRVYRKLGIHSRAELGARLAGVGREAAQT